MDFGQDLLIKIESQNPMMCVEVSDDGFDLENSDQYEHLNHQNTNTLNNSQYQENEEIVGDVASSTGGRIFYCKSRGMVLDHRGSRAVLCFDEGMYLMHGAELKCSHALCRKDGVKFRYCLHCDKGEFFFFDKFIPFSSFPKVPCVCN